MANQDKLVVVFAGNPVDANMAKNALEAARIESMIKDELMGTIIEAHVVLAPGMKATDALRGEILGFARSRLGPALAPRALQFLDHLPRTPSGKIVRKDLGTPSS